MCILVTPKSTCRFERYSRKARLININNFSAENLYAGSESSDFLSEYILSEDDQNDDNMLFRRHVVSMINSCSRKSFPNIFLPKTN